MKNYVCLRLLPPAPPFSALSFSWFHMFARDPTLHAAAVCCSTGHARPTTQEERETFIRRKYAAFDFANLQPATV